MAALVAYGLAVFSVSLTFVALFHLHRQDGSVPAYGPE